MDDIQDGRKISIQDGVEEDPEKQPLLSVSSGTARTFIATEIVHPQVTTIVRTFPTATKKVATMTTVLSTQVT